MKVHAYQHDVDGSIVEYWYDRSARSWYARLVDVDGNQIGNALNAGTIAGILACCFELRTNLNEIGGAK
jgi:hypothetical protein